MQYPVGSEWRKWDLHVHTPASFHWNGSHRYHEITDEEALRTITTINNSDADVFALQDYWTFDGYFKIKDMIRSDPSLDKKVIFPGIELRIESPIEKRLNVHVIFSEQISDRNLKDFLGNLRIRNVKGSISKETIVSAVQEYMY